MGWSQDWLNRLREVPIKGEDGLPVPKVSEPDPSATSERDRRLSQWCLCVRDASLKERTAPDIDQAIRNAERNHPIEELLGHLYHDPKIQSRAKRILARRLNRDPGATPFRFQVCRFPVVRSDKATGRLFELRAYLLDTKGGLIVPSPGLASTTDHTFFERSIDGVALAMLETAADAVCHSLGKDRSVLPDIELVWSEVDLNRGSDTSSDTIAGGSLGFAAYCVLRALWDEAPFNGERACLSGLVVAKGDGYGIGDITGTDAKRGCANQAINADSIDFAVFQNANFPTVRNDGARIFRLETSGNESLEELWEHVVRSHRALRVYCEQLIAQCEDIGDANKKQLADLKSIPIRVGIKRTEAVRSEKDDKDGAKREVLLKNEGRSDPKASEQESTHTIEKVEEIDVVQWARQCRGISMVVSGPGTGKTVATHKLAQALAREWLDSKSSVQPVPIHIPLKEVSKLLRTLDGDILLRCAVKFAGLADSQDSHLLPALRTMVRQGRAFIIIDSLDQFTHLSNGGILDQLAEVFARWTSTSAGSKILVTSREFARGYLDRSLAKLERRLDETVTLQPFRSSDARSYANVVLGEGGAARVLNMLRDPRASQELVIPKILSLTCAASTDGMLMNQLENYFTRAKLYKAFVKSVPSVHRVAILLLHSWQDVAISNGVSSASTITREEFETQLTYKDLAGLSALEAGWAVEGLIEASVVERHVEGTTEYLEPAHKSLWEYLAGSALAHRIRGDGWRHWKEAVVKLAWSPKWEEVIVFAFDCLANLVERFPDRGEVLSQIIADLMPDNSPFELVGYRARLISRLCQCVRAPLPDKAQEAVGLMQQLEMLRVTGVHNMGPGEIQQLLPARTLDGISGRIPGIAPNEEIGQRVLEILDRRIGEGDLYVRRTAAVGLGQVAASHPDAAQRVIEILEGRIRDEEWHVRRAVVTALGQVAASSPALSRRVLEILEGMIGDNDGDVREAVATALGQVAAPSPKLAESVLVTLAAKSGSKYWGVREAVARSLGAVSSYSPEHADRILRILVRRIAAGDLYVIDAVATSLGQVSSTSPELAEKVCRLLEGKVGHKDEEVRQAAVISLGQVVAWSPALAERVLRILEVCNEVEDADVRASVLMSLGHVAASSPDLAERVFEILKAKTREISGAEREATATSLGLIAASFEELAERVLPILERWVADGDGDVRAAVVTSLGQVVASSPDLAERVLGVLEERIMDFEEVVDGDVLVALTETLGQVATSSRTLAREALRRFEGLFGDHHGFVDDLIAMLLGQVATSHPSMSEQVLRIVEKRVEQPHGWRRLRSLGRSLGQVAASAPIMAERILAILQEGIVANGEDVREAVAASLGQLATAVPRMKSRVALELDKLTQDSSDDVRLTVAKELARVGFHHDSSVSASNFDMTYVAPLRHWHRLARGIDDPKAIDWDLLRNVNPAIAYWTERGFGDMDKAVRLFDRPEGATEDTIGGHTVTLAALTEGAVLPTKKI